MEYKISNLPRVVLDPRNDQELFEQAVNRTIAASGNRLRDFKKATVANGVLTGEVFAIAELFWYLNKLPTALAIELLRLFGVQRSLGTKASGKVTVLLSQALQDNFILPAGHLIPFRDNVYFVTTQELVIPPRAYEGTVAVQASKVGVIGNVPKLGLVQTSTNLNYVSMIYNTEDIAGGTDIEPLLETVRRGQEALRRRDTLVTLADYESAAQDILGYGSKALAIPTMNQAKQDGSLGHVHLFVVDALGNPASPDVCSVIRAELLPLVFTGSALWVSPVELIDVSVSCVLETSQISPELSDDVFSTIVAYLKPSNYTTGATLRIKELEYIIRAVPGITGIQYVTVNLDTVNYPMPQRYTSPNLIELSITLVDPRGVSSTFTPLLLNDPD